MIRKIFPIDSKQFNYLRNIFKSFDKSNLDNFEILFPIWCMFAFQHYIIKSYNITIFSFMEIDLNTNYTFSLIAEDLIGVTNIFFHTICFLWLMKKFPSFAPFKTLKNDSKMNFLLFTTLYCLVDIFIFGKMMIGFFLMLLSLYVLYRSQSLKSLFICLALSVMTLIFSQSVSEPILSTGAAIFLPIIILCIILRSKIMISYAQKNLLLIMFIFISTKELWFGFMGMSYFMFFNLYYYFVDKSNYNWLKLD